MTSLVPPPPPGSETTAAGPSPSKHAPTLLPNSPCSPGLSSWLTQPRSPRTRPAVMNFSASAMTARSPPPHSTPVSSNQSSRPTQASPKSTYRPMPLTTCVPQSSQLLPPLSGNLPTLTTSATPYPPPSSPTPPSTRSSLDSSATYSPRIQSHSFLPSAALPIINSSMTKPAVSASSLTLSSPRAASPLSSSSRASTSPPTAISCATW